MMPLRAVACQLVPAAEAYWTLQPLRSTSTVPLLASSMKSLVNVAPELPPPPYTWLITTSGDAAPAAVAGNSAATVAATTIVTDRVRIDMWLFLPCSDGLELSTGENLFFCRAGSGF